MSEIRSANRCVSCNGYRGRIVDNKGGKRYTYIELCLGVYGLLDTWVQGTQDVETGNAQPQLSYRRSTDKTEYLPKRIHVSDAGGIPKYRNRVEFLKEIVMEQKKKNQKQGKSKKGIIILLVILAILLPLLIWGGVRAYKIFVKPHTIFDPSTAVTAEPTAAATPAFDIIGYLPTDDSNDSSLEDLPTPPPETPVPEATETPKVTEAPATEAPMSGIVNIALLGIDAGKNGSTTSGTMPHADTLMVVAVNFNTKEVSLISVARDCLTRAPGYLGYYKLNGIFNVGGGMKDPHGGFQLTCRALEKYLGGVSIPYYYGVDYLGVVDLVDAIGGIDYNLDIPVGRKYTLDGSYYSRGWHHLDGNGVLGYLRMRTGVTDGLDSARTDRQRRMMVAVFKKLKDEGKLSTVPDLLKIVDKHVYTNTTVDQTIALINFAMQIDPESIRMYGISGDMIRNYTWRFCFLDQQNRLDILKTVYGINATPIGVDTADYEHFLYDSGFAAMKYLNITKKLFAEVNKTPESEMSEEQKKAYAVCWQDYTNLQELFDNVDAWTQDHCIVGLTKADKQQRKTYYSQLKQLEAKLEKSADALNEAFGKPIKPRWNQRVDEFYMQVSDINEVYVDFR